MTASQKNSVIAVLFFFLIAGLALTMSYFVVAKGMEILLYGAIFLMIFLVCFFSVRISLVLLLLSMLLSPEIAIGQTAAHDVTIRLEDFLLLIMTIGWLLRMAIIKDLGFMTRNPLNLPMVVFSMLAIISTLFGAFNGYVNPLAGFFFVLKIMEYFILFNVIVNYSEGLKDCHQLLTVMLITCGITCIYCFIRVLMGASPSAPFDEGERNTLGGYLTVMGAVVTGVYFYTESKLERHLLAALLPVLGVVLLFSMSRSGWVSSSLVVLILAFSVKKRRIYFIPILLILAAVPFFAPQKVEERAMFTISQGESTDEQVQIGRWKLDSSTSGRIVSLKYVLQAILDNALIGRGVTGWRFLDGQFARTLIEMGFLGLGVFLWLLAQLHSVIRHAISIDLPPRFQGMVIGFYAAFWGLMAHALTANTFIIVRIAEPFWCLAGITVVLIIHKSVYSPDPAETAAAGLPGSLAVKESL